jgi:bifunctional enzyme CysN/CysC
MITVDPNHAQEKMNIVFVGHVDHGKSTVIGRLLADTGSLPQGKLEQVRANCERNSRPFEYALLIDALKDEQAQNITIDAARVFFKSSQRHYIIIDAPGHIEFIKNMVTGASHAEAALLVIDANEGIQENSRRHGYLLWMLGIRQIVVLVNKMDLVGYRREVFESIQAEYNRYLQEIGVQAMYYVPVSGREGDNICALSPQMPWYNGHTVLSALDSFEKAPPQTEAPFRMPVQDIYRFTLYGDDRRIVAGTVSSGRLAVGDELIFYPSGKRSTIKTFEGYARSVGNEIKASQAAGLTLNEQIYIQRGEIAAKAGEPGPKVSQHIRVSLFWLGKKPFVPKKQYFLKAGTSKVRAQVEHILRIMNSSDFSDSTARGQIEHHEVAELILSLNHPIAFDLSSTLVDTSRFVIVDDYEICGGGIILEDIPDKQAWIRDNVSVRNARWIKSEISTEERAERYNQRSALVVITGQKETGRKDIARLLEKRLFADGKYVYYLGMGSVAYGVDADIKRSESGDGRQEHIRRLAEVAHILVDSGLILIVTAVELTQEDLQILKTIIDPNKIETIWVGENLTTDLHFDLKLVDKDQAEHSVIQIKRLLQDHGFIFSP